MAVFKLAGWIMNRREFWKALAVGGGVSTILAQDAPVRKHPQWDEEPTLLTKNFVAPIGTQSLSMPITTVTGKDGKEILEYYDIIAANAESHKIWSRYSPTIACKVVKGETDYVGGFAQSASFIRIIGVSTAGIDKPTKKKKKLSREAVGVMLGHEYAHMVVENSFAGSLGIMDTFASKQKAIEEAKMEQKKLSKKAHVDFTTSRLQAQTSAFLRNFAYPELMQDYEKLLKARKYDPAKISEEVRLMHMLELTVTYMSVKLTGATPDALTELAIAQFENNRLIEMKATLGDSADTEKQQAFIEKYNQTINGFPDKCLSPPAWMYCEMGKIWKDRGLIMDAPGITSDAQAMRR